MSTAAATAAADGVLALDKPAGLTSFDAVRSVRRILGERKVGHAGTLDPTATGLLPICVGRSTRLVDYFHRQTKVYRCRVRLGETSTTLDTEGEIGRSGDASPITEDDVRGVLGRFIGEIEQRPPMHSAVRHEGRRLYELAREGTEVERKPRTVQIVSIELCGFQAGEVAEAELEVTSGKGAYMRVLAADIGEALGCGALLSWLSRTRYGSLTLEEAISIDALAALDDPRAALLGPEVAVAFLPRVDVAPAVATQVMRGQSVWVPRQAQPANGEARLHSADGRLIALGNLAGGHFRPTKVLAT